MKLNISKSAEGHSWSKVVFLGVLALLSLNICATTLSKTAIGIKQDFDAMGATSCSQSMAEVYDFLTDGKDSLNNKIWAKKDASKKSILIDFTIYGTKTSFARTGTIILTPAENACRGMYAYQQTLSNKKCSIAMKEQGFIQPTWTVERQGSNGDGGEFFILGLNDSPELYFNLNDIPGGGCILNKRELLNKSL